VGLPLKLDSTGVDNPNEGGEGDTDWASVPIRQSPFDRSRDITHNKAPPRKAKVDPTYIGSEKKLNGKPVTREDMRIPK
jgi:hypothetical protein